MALPKFEEDVQIIAKLDDEPNDVGGLDSAQLKAKFDEAAGLLKEFINTVLLPALEGETASTNIGVKTISGISEAKTVQEALEALKYAIDNTATGSIPDDSLEGIKLKAGAVGARELALNSVANKNIANVSGAKVDEKSLPGATLEDESIDSRHYKPLSIQTSHMADECVDTGKVKNYSLTANKYAPGSVGATALAADAKSRGVAVVLASSAWADNMQTVNVEGVTADNNVLVAADPASRTAWNDAEIYCSAQAEGALTFSCVTVPGADVTANVVILA